MTRLHLILIAAGGSAALLLGAFGFQMLGYQPCAMCLWQRWPHVIGIALGLLAWKMGAKIWPAIGAVTMAVSAGLGIYHTGVERGFWEGPSSCTGSGLSSSDNLLSLEDVHVVLCDDVVWELFGLSMASYNALASLVFMAAWVMFLRRS